VFEFLYFMDFYLIDSILLLLYKKKSTRVNKLQKESTYVKKNTFRFGTHGAMVTQRHLQAHL
jgi:hypothetical protein